RGSVRPSTAAASRPWLLKSAELRGVAGTAMFRRSMSPRVGKKLLMNGLPGASGLPFLPVANWYGTRLGTPVWKIGLMSTERGLPAAGSRPARPASDLLWMRSAVSAGTAPPNFESSMYRPSSGFDRYSSVVAASA
nr:hypothetical protein [Tanacetum cinerariifolium]